MEKAFYALMFLVFCVTVSGATLAFRDKDYPLAIPLSVFLLVSLHLLLAKI
jgi:hypothetical protein